MRVVAVGGSAGSLPPLRQLVAGLPADLGACVLVTVHTTPTSRGALPRLLAWVGSLPAVHAQDGVALCPNTIIVARPDRHLLVTGGRARLDAGPKVNRTRPSVDVMSRSAAQWAGPNLIAVVLSGMLYDGAAGAVVVAQAGGTVFVQDPQEATHPDMPRAVLAAVPTARTTPTTHLAERLTALAGVRTSATQRTAQAHDDAQQ